MHKLQRIILQNPNVTVIKTNPLRYYSFSISIYVFFYLYRWWLTFKLLFCVFSNDFFCLLVDRRFLGADDGSWNEKKANNPNLFVSDGDFYFPCFNPIKRFSFSTHTFSSTPMCTLHSRKKNLWSHGSK